MNPLRGRWARRVAVAGAVWLAICVTAFLLGNDPRPGLLALVIAVVTATACLFVDTSVEAGAPRWRLVDDDPVRPRGEDTRLALFQRLVGGHLDARDVTDRLHRQLAEIADRRLVTKHGISRRADPGRAADVMGPELARFLDEPHARRLSLSELDQVLTRIEAL